MPRSLLAREPGGHHSPSTMANKKTLRIERLVHASGIDLPTYATTGSAGLDIRAAISTDMILDPGAFEAVPTGLRLEIPAGFEIQVRPRSGLAAKHGVTVLNAPGTIDSDYRGELKVLLVNHGREPFTIKRGDRIAQLVLAKVERIAWTEADSLDATDRGEGGFGHTGV